MREIKTPMLKNYGKTCYSLLRLNAISGSEAVTLGVNIRIRKDAFRKFERYPNLILNFEAVSI